MTQLKTLSSVALIAVLGASFVSACNDDDDDDNGNVAGHSGMSHGGRPNGGTSGAAQGGDPAQGGDRSSAGQSQGGAAGEGGMPSVSAGANQGGMAGDSASAGGAGGAAATLALSDAQILLVLDTLNQGEVEEAYAVLPRLSSAGVKAFAQQMVTDHSDARQSVAATAEALDEAPEPSGEQAKLKGEAEAHVAMLRAASAASLDTTYMGLQVEAHAEALALLDELAAAADAAELSALIAMLRVAVQQHYDDAQALLADL